MLFSGVGIHMKELVERIRLDGVHVGGGIVKVDSFLNHQVDPALMQRMAKELHRQFITAGVDNVTHVVTAEASGIAIALTTAAQYTAKLIFARKGQSRVMTGTYYVSESVSRTRGTTSELMIDRRFLGAEDHVLIVDDFLATGSTLNALASLVSESGASLVGVGCVIEKPAEGGREALSHIRVPILSLARINFSGDAMTVY